jgi:hypothetical protein
VNPAFGSLHQAGGNKENIPKPEYANIWYLESIFTIPAQPKEMLGMMVTKHAQDFIIN